MSQLAHRTAVELLTAAGAIPSNALVLMTELFRDWKSPLTAKGRDIIKWYLAEVQRMTAEVNKKAV
jgi:hypothetical protein